MDDLRTAVQQTVTETVAREFRSHTDGFFANARKAGLISKDKPSPTAPASQVTNEAPGAGGAALTASEVQQMMSRDRDLYRTIASADLNDEQAAFIEETFRAVNPPDPRAWATGFLKTMGFGKRSAVAASPQPTTNETNKQATGAPVTSAQPAQAKPAANISDMGPSASSAARDPEAIIRHRITDATGDDFERLAAQHGRDKAHQMWAAEARAQLRSIKLVPPGRQR